MHRLNHFKPDRSENVGANLRVYPEAKRMAGLSETIDEELNFLKKNKIMKKIITSLTAISICILLTSCEKALTQGKKLPQSNALYVWQNVYKSKDLDGKRIALEGYISLANWREKGDEDYCEFVDEKGMHLMFITIKRKSKNALKIHKTGKTEKINNINYVDFDEAQSYIIDNEGNKLTLSQKILLSFDIKYIKHKDTGFYPVSVVADTDLNGNSNLIQRIAKKGDKYYLFNKENLRIDKWH